MNERKRIDLLKGMHYSTCAQARSQDFFQEGANLTRAQGTPLPKTENSRICRTIFGSRAIHFSFSYFYYKILFHFSAQGGYDPLGPPLATSLRVLVYIFPNLCKAYCSCVCNNTWNFRTKRPGLLRYKKVMRSCKCAMCPTLDKTHYSWPHNHIPLWVELYQISAQPVQPFPRYVKGDTSTSAHLYGARLPPATYHPNEPSTNVSNFYWMDLLLCEDRV